MKQGDCYEFSYSTPSGERHARGRFNGIEYRGGKDMYTFSNAFDLVTGERQDILKLSLTEMRNMERVEGPC